MSYEAATQIAAALAIGLGSLGPGIIYALVVALAIKFVPVTPLVVH